MTARKETFPKHSYTRAGKDGLERIEATFTLTCILKGDVCSKQGVIDDLNDTLRNRIDDLSYDTDVEVDSYDLVMTGYKPVK